MLLIAEVLYTTLLVTIDLSPLVRHPFRNNIVTNTFTNRPKTKVPSDSTGSLDNRAHRLQTYPVSSRIKAPPRGVNCRTTPVVNYKSETRVGELPLAIEHHLYRRLSRVVSLR